MPRQPNTAINSRSVQPAFAILVAASLRRPCAEHCRKPASLQRVRNQLPKPLNENGRGTSLSACANSGANRHNQCQISAIEFDSDQCCSGLERLSCNRDGLCGTRPLLFIVPPILKAAHLGGLFLAC